MGLGVEVGFLGGEGRVGGKAYCSYLPFVLYLTPEFFRNLPLSILITNSVTELTGSAFALGERQIMIIRILS